ncbi:MAG: alpha/beta hydrolase [Streptococcaceae bacterium]|jgi:fermentation-respiration switch protein FrsA (DUF1100 family)|nr:alpha/beta hydrolase [Streptococcaceae bacterium]
MVILWIILALIPFYGLILPYFLMLIAQHKWRFLVVGAPKPGEIHYEASQSYLKAPKEIWEIHREKWTLYGDYLPAEIPTHKTILMANGYHSTRATFSPHAWLFHRLGYNVLNPEHFGDTEAQGHYVGFGWPDRADYKAWLQLILQKDPEAEMVMYGVSMGAASSLMLSGEPDLPQALHAFIADCGYTSLWDEMAHQITQLYHIPTTWPLLPMMSFYSKLFVGYGYKEASSLVQVPKNTRPILLIHGAKDNFVPFWMLDKIAQAIVSEKQVEVFQEAGHAMSFWSEPERYENSIRDFLKKKL